MTSMMRFSMPLKQARPRPSLVRTVTMAPRAAPRAVATGGVRRLVGLGGFTVSLAVAAAANNRPAGCEAAKAPAPGPGGGGGSILDDLKKLLGLATDEPTGDDGKTGKGKKGEEDKPAEEAEAEEELANDGPGKRVKVDLDPEVVAGLPVMPLAEVRAANGLGGVAGDGQRYNDSTDALG
jgi:hypothetical protein